VARAEEEEESLGTMGWPELGCPLVNVVKGCPCKEASETWVEKEEDDDDEGGGADDNDGENDAVVAVAAK
jgi:hypothetical protein